MRISLLANLLGTAGSKSLREDEELRGFYQDRILLLAKIGFILTLSYYFLCDGILVLLGRRGPGVFLSVTENQSILCGLALTGAVWLVCSLWRISGRFLVWLDAVALLGFTTSLALQTWLSRANVFFPIYSLLPTTIAIIGRAILVPSTVLHSSAISLLCYFPSYVAAWFIWQPGAVDWPESLDRPPLAMFVVNSILGVPLAAVASGVIYGLRREVERAQQLGQYRLEEKIGEGGMGEVYRASHAFLRRPTAIKLLRREIAGDRSIARFEREVQLTSQLTHPNTIAIYDYGRTPGGVFYYAMEYLEGMNLQDLVAAHGPLPPGRIVYILEQVCASLGEAHAKGIIHRDIKPANIILCERGGRYDVAKVVDFGLVKHVEARGGVTISGVYSIAGTPFFMAPEAIRSPEKVDPRADLYAVGALGYYLLTGHFLFASASPVEVLSDQLHTQPERPSSRIARSVPSDLESLVLRALEKDPARRPQSADELREAFLACADAGSWSDRHAREWWAARRDDRARQAAERLAAAQVALKKASPRAATLSVHLDESRFAATGER